MSETAIDTCAEALRTSILRGELQPGTRLPPERELATRFGVHRATVRSALARLTAAGLVTPRQGSGYEIQDFRRSGGPDLLRDLVALASGKKLDDAAEDLLRVRRALARAVLEKLSADPISARARSKIAASVDAFAAAVEAKASIDAIAAADLAVVAAIVEATGSPVLQLCMNPIAALVGELPRLRDAIYAEPTWSVLGWRALVLWLETAKRSDIDTILAAMDRRDAETLEHLAKPRRSR